MRAHVDGPERPLSSALAVILPLRLLFQSATSVADMRRTPTAIRFLGSCFQALEGGKKKTVEERDKSVKQVILTIFNL